MPGFEIQSDFVIRLIHPTRIKGSWKGTLRRIASIAEAEAGDVSFLANRKYLKQVPGSAASLLILPEDYTGEPRENQVFLLHGNPSRAVDLLAEYLQKKVSPRPEAGIHPSAYVHPSVSLPESVHIGAMAVVEEGAQVGEWSVLHAHAYVGRFARIGSHSILHAGASVLDYCLVGDDCVLQGGCVIGSDGFGYETVDGQHLRSPQIGIVVLEDHVDIGANTTIDRARFSETRIGQGTKIDNLVQIAHNVTIGKGCFLASQVGIAGSTKIGDFVLMGGQSGASGHLTIGDHCQIGGTTAVYQNLPPNSFVSGDPAMPYYQAQKFNVLRKKLPDLFRRVDSLPKHPQTDP